MCTSSCGMLYKEGKPLKEITCPCGLGYWDIFRERFVSGDQIREGEPSRREYEAKVKAKLKEPEFEARLREQWIHHFLSCPTKLALDERAIRDGTGDTSSRRKAEAELREIASGDFQSRGRSQAIREWPRGQVQTNEGEWRRRATSQETSRKSSSWDAAGPDVYTLFDRHRPTESVASGYDKDASTVAVRSQGHNVASDRFFLPGDGIRPDVLDHHCKSNIFGRGATARPYTSSDGRRGYLISATTKPTTELISQLKKDSIKVEEALRLKSETDQRASVDLGRREGARPALSSAHRDSQTTRYTVDDIAQVTGDLRITPDRSRRIGDRGQNDRAPRQVTESPPAIIEQHGQYEPEDPSPERESLRPELGDVHLYSVSDRQDVNVARKGDLKYRRGSGDIVVARRDSRRQPREIRYQQRDSLHGPRDTRTATDTRRQVTTQQAGDRQDNRQRDARRDPRNTDEEAFEDLPPRRRYDGSRP